MKVRYLIPFLALLLAGCPPKVATLDRLPSRDLAVSASLELAGPAVDLCRDGEDLLVLEASGTRVLRLGFDLAIEDTVVLSERLEWPRGIAADRYYIYVHEDEILYRLLKDELELTAWLNNVRVAGLASYAPGEMLVSDEDRGMVWYKTLFGESRRFLDVSDIGRPGALTRLPEDEFAALGGTRELVRFNRAGIVTGRRELGGDFDLMCADPEGTLYLGRTGQPLVLVVSGEGDEVLHLPPTTDVAALCGDGRRLCVLESSDRISLYELP